MPNHPRLWAVTASASQPVDPVVVRERALLAKKSGMDGVISSPHEIEDIKKACCSWRVWRNNARHKDGERKTSTTRKDSHPLPGVIRAGANFIKLLAGPVIRSRSPSEAAKIMTEEIEKASTK